MFLYWLINFSGIIGLLCMVWGVFLVKNKKRAILYILGGIALLIYSISKKDLIFICLQSFFIFASIFEFLKIKK